MATESSRVSGLAAADTADQLYAAVEAYPWTEDAEFQVSDTVPDTYLGGPARGGLSAILGANASPEQAQALTPDRKHGVAVDFDGYKAWRSGHPPSPQSSAPVNVVPSAAATAAPASAPEPSGVAEAPYPTSFAHIVNLITKGDPIPGIKEIPNTVLEGKESQSTAAARRKPWEKDPSAASTADSSTTLLQ
ncbi:MAG: hypothetical protein M1838_002027 [Thelocarpon superellum]|nr:MAG: hypothetical protein M1838_002027 [Thelocarpon superellum]